MNYFTLRNNNESDLWVSHIVIVSDSTYSRLRLKLHGLTATQSIHILKSETVKEKNTLITAASMAEGSAVWV